jgi:hypothetical protein
VADLFFISTLFKSIFIIRKWVVVRVGLEPTMMQPFLVGCDNLFPHYALPDYIKLRIYLSVFE